MIGEHPYSLIAINNSSQKKTFVFKPYLTIEETDAIGKFEVAGMVYNQLASMVTIHPRIINKLRYICSSPAQSQQAITIEKFIDPESPSRWVFKIPVECKDTVIELADFSEIPSAAFMDDKWGIEVDVLPGDNVCIVLEINKIKI